MADAYRCDRCGKYFEDHLVPLWIFAKYDYDRRSNAPCCSTDKLDLCDSCKVSYNEWLHNK